MTTLFGENFRKWWQVPSRMEDRDVERTVTFLELFYDLVYVVLIAQLAHKLAEHIDWLHVGQFGFLFIIVWWSWLNGMSYHDLHGNHDIRTRVFTFLQMICVAAMAAFAHDPLGETSIPFALAYGTFQLILTFMWWRVGVHDPSHRIYSNPYSAIFLLSTLLFFGSVFVAEGLRPYLWGIGVFISILLPLLLTVIARRSPDVQEEVLDISPSMVERFGLLTIIVLGEVVVGVVTGLSEHHHLTLHVGLIALLALLIGIGLWWIYFDSVSHRLPIARQSAVLAYLYLHIPLTASIAAVGAANANVVEHAGDPLAANVRWLLVGSVATAMIVTAVLVNLVNSGSAVDNEIHNRGRNATLVSAVGVLLIGILPIGTTLTLTIIVLLLLLPVYFALRVWLSRYNEWAANQHGAMQ